MLMPRYWLKAEQPRQWGVSSKDLTWSQWPFLILYWDFSTVRGNENKRLYAHAWRGFLYTSSPQHQGSKSIMEEGEERMQVLEDVEDPVKCCGLAVAHMNSQWLWLPIEDLHSIKPVTNSSTNWEGPTPSWEAPGHWMAAGRIRVAFLQKCSYWFCSSCRSGSPYACVHTGNTNWTQWLKDNK